MSRKDSLKREEIHPGQPGYYDKNLHRYRYCNEFHPEGLRCTRTVNHAGPHAAHMQLGIAGTTEEVLDDKGNIIDVRVKQGMRNTEDVQIATW
jgi:hypothetical protein